MANVLETGKQRIEFEDDGIVVFRVRETISPSDAVAFDQAMRQYQETHKEAVLIVDFTHGSGIEAAARRTIIDGVNAKPYAVCFLKASFALRALVGLMLNASKVLGKSYPHHFSDTEDDARAWAKALPRGWA